MSKKKKKLTGQQLCLLYHFEIKYVKLFVEGYVYNENNFDHIQWKQNIWEMVTLLEAVALNFLAWRVVTPSCDSVCQQRVGSKLHHLQCDN